MSTTTTTPSTRDKLISDANSLPALLATAKTDDPSLYAALVGSNDKAVWLSPATFVVSWAAARWLGGLDGNVCSAIALVLGSAVLGVWHWVSPRIVPAPPAQPEARS